MNKTQLIDELSSRFEGNKKAAGQALEAVVDTITRTVAKGEKVAITGFGVFEKIDKPARFARNPATGERVRVKKTSVPRFKAGTGFKDVVSGAKKLPKLTTTKAAERGRSAATTAKQGAGKVTAAGRAAAGTARERVATATKKGPAAKSSASPATAKKAAGGAAAKKAAPPKSTASKTTAARKTRSSTSARAES
jgi:DNA-binding protein HU-beta